MLLFEIIGGFTLYCKLKRKETLKNEKDHCFFHIGGGAADIKLISRTKRRELKRTKRDNEGGVFGEGPHHDIPGR